MQKLTECDITFWAAASNEAIAEPWIARPGMERSGMEGHALVLKI